MGIISVNLYGYFERGACSGEGTVAHTYLSETMNASAGGGTARALNSRRLPKGLQSFAILLACLGFYCLFTNVNLLRLYSEGKKYGPGCWT
jgi:hypothetical protein